MKLRRVLCAAFMFFAARELCVMADVNEYGDIAMWNGYWAYPSTEGGARICDAAIQDTEPVDKQNLPHHAASAL